VNPGDEIFLDTNVIIEAFRVKVWKPLAQTFRLSTVEECAIEAATGYKRRKGYVAVDLDAIRATASIHKPEFSSVVSLTRSLPAGLLLDPGERDLTACAIARPHGWLFCSADAAAVRALHVLGKLGQAVSLEAIVRVAKLNPNVREQFAEKWLSDRRTRLELGVL
jgi:hypothetical protein